VIAGSLRASCASFELSSGNIHVADTLGVDVTYTEWRPDGTLLLAGHRGFHTVIGRYDPVAGGFVEIWSGNELSTSGRYASISGLYGGETAR
jgi:hypothetical protein